MMSTMMMMMVTIILMMKLFTFFFAWLQLSAKFAINEITPGHGVIIWVCCAFGNFFNMMMVILMMIADSNLLLSHLHLRSRRW